MIPVYVGFDKREAVAYHVFCQSVIERCSKPHLLSFRPVMGRTDGSNAFTLARFSALLDCSEPWGIFLDGDMTCLADICELYELRDKTKAVQVVKHDYRTKFPVKYWGQRNEDYDRKNWSSVMLWNARHWSHTKAAVQIRNGDGPFLHRFAWLDDDEIGELPREWNWLAKEYPHNPDAKIVHHTIGLPLDPSGEGDPWAEKWNEEFLAAMRYRA